MTPFELGILFHYYTRPTDCDACERNVAIWAETRDRFLADGLLVRAPEPIRDACYVLGDRGRAYVEAVQRVPLPVASWRIDWPTEDQA